MAEKDWTGVFVTGPSTPYVSPEMLMAAPTGISWSTIGSASGKPTQAEIFAEVANICARASAMVNSMVNSTLRATVDTETLYGPGDFRCQLQPNGRARLLMSRLPIISVVGGQWTPASAFPAQYTPIAANQFRVERPVGGSFGSSAPGGSGDGGQSILLAPGIITWAFGRLAYEVQVTYVNGWPHCSNTAACNSGDTSIQVDDITGWLNATGTVHSSSGQEVIQVTSVTPATTGAITGPGTLGLATPLVYQHQMGTIVTTLTDSVQQAVILLCVAQALVRGATATTVQAIPGSRSNTTAGPAGLEDMARRLLNAYKRVI